MFENPVATLLLNIDLLSAPVTPTRALIIRFQSVLVEAGVIYFSTHAGPWQMVATTFPEQ